MENKVRELIADADLVLIGIGKEFEKLIDKNIVCELLI